MICAILLSMYRAPIQTDLVKLTPPEFPAAGETRTVEMDVPSPSFGWDQAVVSWNVKQAEGASLSVEAKVVQGSTESKWFSLGTWSLDPARYPRQSQKDQADDLAEVDTDTLMLKQPGGRLRLRLTQGTVAGGPLPSMSGLWVSFSAPGETVTSAVGQVPPLDVPLRAQGSYPNGGVLCSPTSVSMILAYWAKTRKQPNWDKDVPEVAAGVYDPVWKGTGNWSFNMAFPGSMPGLSSFAARLTGIAELEKLVKAGFPVATSVSYGLLKGKPQPDPDDGHLVVLVGFDADGDPIFNDPGRSMVRCTYFREAFVRAWARSRNTVYLVHPSDLEPPIPVRRA
jgi:hypothetical protein